MGLGLNGLMTSLGRSNVQQWDILLPLLFDALRRPVNYELLSAYINGLLSGRIKISYKMRYSKYTGLK